jgi:hypothetical protein
MEPEKPATPEAQPPEPPAPTPPPAAAEGQPPETPAAASPPQPTETEAPPARKPIDEKMVERLREGARRRRPWAFASCLLTLLLFAVPLGLLVWWFWPRPALPRVVVIAFDQLGVQGRSVTCRAQIVPAVRAEAETDLSGRELTFERRRLGQPLHEQPAREQTVTQADGTAAVKWSLPEGVSRLKCTVRYVEAERRSQQEDHARVFAWPRKTKILLVEAAALPSAGEKLWPEAVRALRAVQAAGFAVGYLATGADGAVAYGKVRSELEGSTTGPKGGIPDGPVLGRLSVGAAAESDLPAAVVAHLRGFDGPVAVLVSRREAEGAYRAAGARVLRVGQGGLGWAEVPGALAK